MTRAWKAALHSFRRRRRLRVEAERHIEKEYGVYIHWSTGPYSGGGTYHQATAFKPTPGDDVGQIIGMENGPNETKALLALHKALKGRPDVWDRYMIAMGMLSRKMMRDGLKNG